MSDLILNNHLINAPILDILKKLKSELINGKLDIIEDKGEYVRVTCPSHNDGHESHPSCSVYSGTGDLEYGWVHCFTCDLSCDLVKFISICLDSSYNEAKQWLIDNFGDTYVKKELNLTDIDLTAINKSKYLDESILDKFESYHPYMTKRGLSDEIISKFEVKYDPATKCIVFPVRNKYGKLVGLTRRSVEGKRFIIDKDFDKENIYLLYDILNNETKEVFVVESQINALVLRSWGYPSIALFGAGTTSSQMCELNKSGVKHFILAYDPDTAGEKGTRKFIKYLRKDIFVDIVKLPDGKDVADLTKEEFERLLV